MPISGSRDGTPALVGVLAFPERVRDLATRIGALGYRVLSIGDDTMDEVDVGLVQPEHPLASEAISTLIRHAVPVLLLSETAAGDHDEGVVGHLSEADAAGSALSWALRHAVGLSRRERDEGNRRMLLAGQVAATVGHELNNALTYVLANLDHAVQTTQELPGVTGELHDILVESQQGVRRLASVVRELGRVARASNSRNGPVYVANLARSALDMAQERLRGRATVRTDIRVRHPVMANEGRLFQVLLNLVINGALAIEPGAPDKNEVVVATRWHGRRVAIEVSDTGVGIPPEMIDRIFDPFFTTRTSARGSGIGLALCRRYVTQMGGTLEVESTEGSGTTMRIILDLSRGGGIRPTLVPDFTASRARILVVDDEVLIGRAIQRALRADHDVVSVTTSEAAMEALEGGRFDLVFTDLWLGTESGVDLYHRIVGRWPELEGRVAFISGGPSEADLAGIEAIGAPRYRKPLTVDELKDAVEAVLMR